MGRHTTGTTPSLEGLDYCIGGSAISQETGKWSNRNWKVASNQGSDSSDSERWVATSIYIHLYHPRSLPTPILPKSSRLSFGRWASLPHRAESGPSCWPQSWDVSFLSDETWLMFSLDKVNIKDIYIYRLYLYIYIISIYIYMYTHTIYNITHRLPDCNIEDSLSSNMRR